MGLKDVLPEYNMLLLMIIKYAKRKSTQVSLNG